LNKTTLYYIPIEPLKERYTEEWYKYMPKEFTKEGFNVIGIDGITLSNLVDYFIMGSSKTEIYFLLLI